jgi:peroxiredoxin
MALVSSFVFPLASAYNSGRHFKEFRMPLTVGQPAPDFELENQDKKKVKLSDLRGKKVVLAFYPLDFSPVCSNEHACFVTDLPQFSAKNAVVLGISVDSVWCHKAFREAKGITYDLLSDMKREVVQKYDLFLPEANIGRRATVIVDTQGNVAWFKEQPLREERNDAEILEALEKTA